MKDQRTDSEATGGDPAPADAPDRSRPKTEGEVRGLRDTAAAESGKELQPLQVDSEEAKLSRKEKAEKIPPPGLMGDVAGPSA